MQGHHYIAKGIHSPCVCRFGLFVPSPGQRHSSSTGQDFQNLMLHPSVLLIPDYVVYKGGGFAPSQYVPTGFVLRVKTKIEQNCRSRKLQQPTFSLLYRCFFINIA